MWFLIYLLVQIEQISAFLAKGEALIWISLVATGGLLFGSLIAERKLWEEFPKVLKTIKVAVIVGVLGVFFSYALPTQKNLAIIVASGATYEVLTSDTAQRVGGKAINALEKKLDEIMEGENVKEAKIHAEKSSGSSKQESQSVPGTEGQDEVHSKSKE